MTNIIEKVQLDNCNTLIKTGCIPLSARIKIADIKAKAGHTQYMYVEEFLEYWNEDKDGWAIFTPDGYKKIIDFYSKGTFEMYEICASKTKNVDFRIQCSYNHKIETKEGWKFACELTTNDKVLVCGDFDNPEWVKVISVNPLNIEKQCFDFIIDSEEHRYYADCFSSYDSN